MIILIMIIIAILFFVSFNIFVSNKAIHYLCSIISVILLCISIGAIVANFKYHYGMHLNNITCTKKLQPTSKGAPLLIYKQLGTSHKHKIILYRNKPNSKHIIHTKISSSVNNRFKSAKHAKLVTTNKKWCYRNSFFKLMFKMAYKPSNKHTTNTFYIPSNWHAVTVEQAKQIKTKAKRIAKQYKQQAQSPLAKQEMSEQLQQETKAEIAKQMMKNPRMTSKQQANITKNIIQHNKLKMKKQMEQKIMQKALS